MWKTFLNNILDIFFPKTCINCNRHGSYLCDDCFYLSEILNQDYCPFCYPAKKSIQGLVCPEHKNQNQIDGLICAVPYSDPIAQKTIKLFKYQPYMKQLAVPLASLLYSHLKQTNTCLKDFTIVPVPYTKTKEKLRGFKPAYELSLIMSSLLDVPIADVLIKTKETKAQAQLNKAQRLENAFNAFSIKDSYKNNLPRRIILLDDVFTTGATANECARILKENGAEFVCAMSVAREFLL